MTIKDDDKVNGAAVNWLTQASFAPPLVVLGSKADTESTDMIAKSGLFCINVLEAGQVPLASAFFKHVEATDHKFGEIEFTDSPNGLPVLKDALGYFECKVRETIAGRPHDLRRRSRRGRPAAGRRAADAGGDGLQVRRCE